MRRQHADNAADDLRGDIHGRVAYAQLAAQHHCYADSRIEVRTRHRAKRQDQDSENRSGRKRVAEKRERAVTTRELRGHDATADNARKQECRSQALRNYAPHVGSAALPTRPISRSWFCSVSPSSERSGSDVKMPMR